MTLEQQIDDLYRLALSEFTAARNALAKTLSGAEAAQVKRLEKPTVVPWAINRLYWRDRARYERLIRSGAALRSEQIAALEGRNADVRRASELHRKAVAEAVERAIALAAEEGVKPGAEPLARMLEALSLAPHPPAAGRLTDLVQPAGFEALTGVRPAAVVAPSRRDRAPVPPTRSPEGPAAAEPSEPPASTIDRAAARRAEAERKKKQARVASAERDLERARAAEARARRELVEAEEQVRAAERALARARES